jgi:hypothetical protein
MPARNASLPLSHVICVVRFSDISAVTALLLNAKWSQALPIVSSEEGKPYSNSQTKMRVQQ